MSRRVQPLRRKNIRATIKALGQGTLPGLVSRYWPQWVAGMCRAALTGQKIAADLNHNRKPDTVRRARQYRVAPPGRRPNPPLPAQQRPYVRQRGVAYGPKEA